MAKDAVLEPLDSPAIRFEAATPYSDLDALARDLDAHRPAEQALIGLDCPITLHVAPVFEPFDAGLSALLEMVRARPWERHLVLLTGTGPRVAALQARVAEVGATALAADASLGGWDRWLWLMARLDAIAAQRLIVHVTPGDIGAHLSARLLAPRYGRRLYLVHHSGLPHDVLPNVTHLVDGLESRNTLRARGSSAHVAVLPPVFRAERRIYQPELPNQPALPGPGRRAAVRWRVARVKWRMKWLKARVERRLARSSLAGAIVLGREITARLKMIVWRGERVTLTAGDESDFATSGPLSFGAVIAEVVRATGGRHLHLGSVSQSFIRACEMALEDAGIARERVRFHEHASCVADGFGVATPGLLVDLGVKTSGHTKAASEAAWLGMQVLRPVPPEDARQIGVRANDAFSLGIARRLAAQRKKMRQDPAFSPDRFARRLNAIISVSEGRIERAPAQGAAAALADVLGTLGAGAVFQPDHYLSQLPPKARAMAQADPLAHYVTIGEALGYHPHPLFDPRLAEQSMARTLGVKEAAAAWPETVTRSVLGRYLVAGGAARPHQFFDPRHYLQQVPVPPATAAVLPDFLVRGQAEGFSPHPLVEVHFLTGGERRNFLATYLKWLGGGMGFSRSSHPLFDAGAFLAADPGNRLRNAAPNLLWAHVIEGNLGKRHPHLLIWPEEVEKSRPGTLVSVVTVLELIAQNRLGSADPHPLVSTSHIVSQAGWLAQSTRHPLRHFLENGVHDNIDPHPWFSTQFYLYASPDVARAGANPLMHYLNSGAREGRIPAAFFNGPAYYHHFLVHHVRAGEEHQPELQDYVRRGAGLFWSALEHQDGLRRLRLDTAVAQFRQEPSGGASIGAKMLREALHPPTGATHPSLITETRPLRCETPQEGSEARDVTQFVAGLTVKVARPSVISPLHISPPSGSYDVPAADAALYPDVTLVAGNDGFLTSAGVWQDHGLASFDPETMEVKGNAAVVAISGDQVLIRRYRHGGTIPAGIFCCGSYSKNYYHFLIETLPRALFAARLAPSGTPVLTDDDMPAQHYQALRLMLPGNPILRLARHRSYKVDRLWAGSMPNSFQDAFLKPEVPPDAVRVHPQILRLYSDLARKICPDVTNDSKFPRKLFIRRVSRWRQMLNAESVIQTLKQRGFDLCDPVRMSFVDQIRALAHADDVVGQSGAHFANLVFARPGTKVFALFSNAPGSNYNLWPVLAAPLGVQVANVVGWRVPGSTGGAAPDAHEHFTVSPDLLTPFFPETTIGNDPKALLDALRQAGADADALTSSWSVTADLTPAGFEDRLIALRRATLAAIQAAPESALEDLLKHPFFADPWTTLKSGYRALTDHDPAEAAAIAEALDTFAQLSSPASQPLSVARMQRLMLVSMLLVPAWKAGLIARPEALSDDMLGRYLRWIVLSPYLFRDGDDAGYVAYCARLLDWIDSNLADDKPAPLRAAVAQMAAGLDMGQLFLIEAPLAPVFAARNRVLERIAVRQGKCRAAPRPADGSQGRRRIGVLFRTFDKGPDSEAVVAMFRAFPRDRYEIFGYSVGFKDRVVSADSQFDRELDGAIEHRRLLSSNPTEMRAQILADDLDLFVFANATTYGIQAQELALYHKVAPIQVVANSHLPQPPGFPSFDAYLTGLSDHPDHEIDQADYPERLLRQNSPVICYMHSLKPRPSPPLDRAALGLKPDDIVMFNAGSLQKLRRDCLMTMMQAVKDVPNGVLMLAPYNPGWAGRAQAFPFNRQLVETAAEVGLDPARIKVLSELTVAEAEAALACSDIYLTPFPHGGATMVHLALIYGVPPVVLRRRSSRSIDQFLVGSLGFTELLVDSKAEYIALAQRLAGDRAAHARLVGRIKAAAQAPVFVDNVEYSRDIEAAFAELLAAASTRLDQ